MIYDLEIIFTNVNKMTSFVDEDRSLVVCEVDENSVTSHGDVGVLVRSLYEKLLDYEAKGLLSSESKVSLRKSERKKHIDAALPFGYVYILDQNEHNEFFDLDSIFTDFSVIKSLSNMDVKLSYKNISLKENSEFINYLKYARNDLLEKLDRTNSNAIFRKVINRLIMNYYRPVQSRKNRYINNDVTTPLWVKFGGGVIEIGGQNSKYLASLVRIIKSEDFSR
ncbi:hypothetical protein VCHA47P369_110013 [Vibrio chagasii]|nr:hypothetical protein VCHA34P114_100136 [Vibrio chagasii]CAH6807146.1 hypothetical protein VCHA36P168_110045 [Vibrio chagasii]CAH6904255.1 hypothetical protein VCHA50O407_100060 [Vibrio chagasii]CAH6906150.1 hypothetical protein VCHA43P282_100045 [Vibrio chagasii]CAH6911495.1 hypothetical protein VCHA48P435_100145 [Vibrio chagasii]